MPSIDSIIGLPGVELVKSVLGSAIEVWCRVTFRPSCAHCGRFRNRIKTTFIRTVKHTRQGERLMLLHIESHKYECLCCHRFFNLRIPGVLPRRKATETFRLDVYERHHGGCSQRLLAKTHQIGEATVERWYQDHVAKRVKELMGRCAPKVLGIDEHFFSKKDGYATTLCDLANHKVYNVVLGRSDISLQRPLERIPDRHRTRIAVMDLSDTYRHIVKKHFPNALIVADRFHVIRLVNHHFLKAWQLLDPVGRKNRGLLSLVRRHERNLKPDQKIKLQNYLSKNSVFLEIYEFKQKLCRLLLLHSKKKDVLRRAAHDLIDMVSKLRATTLEPLKTLGDTLERWKDEIGRMLRFSLSNGITEGFHTKMELISRRAYGFRNFENYRLRVLAHCGWDGVFAVRN